MPNINREPLFMKIVLIKSPKILAPILRKIFKVKK
ncbi:MAG: stage V sporulation protein SpoVM [Clostridia bacterium]|nr:stage V sporulation protein SpoVM [Clostridia bacterium]